MFAALNSPLGYGGAYGAQPPTHTFADVTNIVSTFTNATYGTAPTNTYGTRLYPSACVKSLDFSGNAEQLLNIKMAGDSWLSVLGDSGHQCDEQFQADPELEQHRRHRRQHRLQHGHLRGDRELQSQRETATQVYWIVAGTQTPYVIGRGPLTMDGSIDWDPTNSETPLDLMLLNAQAPVSITVSNSRVSRTQGRRSR